MEVKGDNMAEKFKVQVESIQFDGTIKRFDTLVEGTMLIENSRLSDKDFSSAWTPFPKYVTFALSGQCIVDEKGVFATVKHLSKEETYSYPIPEKVIFNDPATIVYWNDGTKTLVKCYDDYFDEEKGLAMAYLKRICGNKGNYNDIFRKQITEE